METQGDAPESGWFDMTRIKQLVKLMRDNELSEIDLQTDKSRLRLRRGLPAGSVGAPVTYAAVSAPAPTPAAPAAAAAAEPAPPAAASNLTEIKSPIVGTYYSASGPDSEPFVKVGSRVTAESVVCIVEAMKVFNEIPAGCVGVIRQILVENGAPVEYGQVLYRVEAG